MRNIFNYVNPRRKPHEDTVDVLGYIQTLRQDTGTQRGSPWL